MSTGQKPRWRWHFPQMRERGRMRGRSFYAVQYDDIGPVWPVQDRAETTHYRRYPHPRSGRGGVR